jgi:hypothetical protein
MGMYTLRIKDPAMIMALEEKISELQAELEQVTKQHSEAIAFANAKKEQALTLNGAILAYKAIMDEQPAPAAEEAPVEDNPCATGNCPIPSEDC